MRSCSSHSLSSPLSATEIRRIVADEVSEQIRRYHNRNRLVFYNISEDIAKYDQVTFIRRILDLEINIPIVQRTTAFSIVRRLGNPSENKVRPLLVDLKDLPMPSLKELARKMKDPFVKKEDFPTQIVVRKMETQQQRKEGYLKRTERRKNEPSTPPNEQPKDVPKPTDGPIIVKSETTHEPVSIPVSAEFFDNNEDLPQAEFCMSNGFLHPALIEGTAEYKTLFNFNNNYCQLKPTVSATKEELVSWKGLDQIRKRQWHAMKSDKDYYESANMLMRKSVQYYYDNDNYHYLRVPWFVNDWKHKDNGKEFNE